MHLCSVLLLKWIVRNRTVFWYWNCALMLTWIVWNRNVYMYKMDLALIIYNGWCPIKPNQTKPNQTKPNQTKSNYNSFESFSYQCLPMVSHCSLSRSKPLQVSRTLLGILADLSNAVVWMVSACPLISKFSSLFTNPLVTEPRAQLQLI